MPTLSGQVIAWTAPRNKADAARYWGHSGTYTLAVADEVELELRNAIEGVILRGTEQVSEEVLGEFVGAEVVVEGDFDLGREVEAGAQAPMAQTLMRPSLSGQREPAPTYEGAGFRVQAIRPRRS